ncbi:MAG: bifunctional diaminohydroxyphosphoribosylaminopyrimidine deaminase/5-amino-6-(5-phosphoribosylamino)uracil reductase RibD [Desulfurivibrio sp.]|nr:bifunctional diaminohydroxyphosphoribosylaminopyrimidine deaminase/5-amino-6-(5-phosphoribosylamino)uracil reductase RibD [Desulfurivibrio sp.]
MTAADRTYMRLALTEARKGIGKTAPNPCVGAVVVKDDRVVSKGWHRRVGQPHAEAEALRAAGAAAAGATIYVTLEPCNHHGRTPPCSETIIAAGIRRVVYGLADPHEVARGGAERLEAAGLEVVGGVLAEECRRLNLPFIKRVTCGRPWVLLKAAVSLDGRIAAATGHSQWITGPPARRLAHRLRQQSDAILVGSGTVLADDPSLTTRLPGGRRGRDPLRVVLDSQLQTPPTARMLGQQSAAATWIFCAPEAAAERAAALEAAGARIVRVERTPGEAGEAATGGLELWQVLRELAAHGVNQLLVEGGGRVHGSFLRQNLADEAVFCVAPLLIGADGLPVVAPLNCQRVDNAPRLREVSTRRLGDDIMLRGFF